jgi:EgtB-related family protein
VVAKLEQSSDGDHEGFQLALVHEDMHAEALAMTLTTLGLPLPGVVPRRVRLESSGAAASEIGCDGGDVYLGANSRSFAFDNERPLQVDTVRPFSIDARVVSENEFESFVTSSAYHDPSLWSPDGIAWKERVAGTSCHSRSAVPSDDVAAMHVNYFQAEAYCRWTSRRLPTESEWEHAALANARFAISSGHVWEWTASPFAPRPGFREGRYREYSQPWFHTHRVLKGGSFVTHPRLKYAQYRNFYTPERQDMFCGFRTCANT